MANEGDHEDGAGHDEREDLDGLDRGELHHVDARDGGERGGGDADGAEHGGHAVGDEAGKNRGHRGDAEGHEHARWDGDGGAKARHALEEAAEAPADEQRQDAAVGGDGAEHALDRLHGAGVDREVVGEHGGDDDDHDGPDRHGKALEGGGRHVDGGHPPAERRADRGDDEGAEAGEIGLHVQAAQGDDQPDDRRKRKDEHSKELEHSNS